MSAPAFLRLCTCGHYASHHSDDGCGVVGCACRVFLARTDKEGNE